MTKCLSADVVVNCATDNDNGDGDSILFLHFTGAVFSFQFSCTFRLVSGRTTFKFWSLPAALVLLHKIAKFVLSSATTTNSNGNITNNNNIHVRAAKYLKFSVVSVLSSTASAAQVSFFMPSNSMSEAS